MKDPYALRKETFDALLALFSTDREEAGAAYEKMRRGLVRFFDLKGCRHSDELADETLSRVAAKAESFNASPSVKPTAYIYGFASKILLEYKRRPAEKQIELDPVVHSGSESWATETGEDDPALDRLEGCLAEISDEDRRLLILYYSKEKAEKIKLRKQLAAELGCEMDALHMRVYRLRKSIKAAMIGIERDEDG